MQVEGTRLYRVKDVAGHFDVSVSTIYRAIECGALGALKLGTGQGAVRVPGSAVLAYAQACEQAAYEAAAAASAAAGAGVLSPAQADGLACVVCGVDYLMVAVARVPVGRCGTGSQVFACTVHSAAVRAAAGVELVGAVSR